MEKLLLYCTKATPYLVKDEDCLNNPYYTHSSEQGSCGDTFNGKIVAECECDLVEPFTTDYRMNREQTMRISKDSCLTINELSDYENRGESCPCLYGLHLKNVKVLNFDEQNRFGSFNCLSSNSEIFKPIKRAPQNMMKVYYGDGEIISEEEYILISIKPQYLVHILNGEKTIEVRKKILNSLKELIV